MNTETNLAVTTPDNEALETSAVEPKPNEKLLIFAPRGQVPVQLEHWLRKRQVAVAISENQIEAAEVRQSGARYVLVDLDARPTTDTSFIRQLRSDVPGLRVLVTTASTDQRFIESLTEAGASGVILKRPYVADVALAIQAASEGRTFVSGAAGQRDATHVQITARERQVLELMANGYSNQAIGEKLSISVKTVEAHRARLFKKLGASNVADAVLLAIRVGLIVP
jgi:DNA-binding NarL/FixJ family response regulator